MTDTQLTEDEKQRLTDPVEVPREPAKARGWAPPRGSLKSTMGFVALLLGGIALALYAWGLWPFGSAIQATDNAYVRGQTTIIAPQVNGYVT